MFWRVPLHLYPYACMQLGCGLPELPSLADSRYIQLGEAHRGTKREGKMEGTEEEASGRWRKAGKGRSGCVGELNECRGGKLRRRKDMRHGRGIRRAWEG